MKILFIKNGRYCEIVDQEKMIFYIENTYYDINGNKVTYNDPGDSELTSKISRLYQPGRNNAGITESLISETSVEPEYFMGDIYGNYGFKNQDGEFVIEPQYASAYEFSHGLAAVNLNKTWYKTPEGKRCYENHWGYIDENGKTVIGFKYDSAYPFNEYGVAVVSERLKNNYHLIDINGNEIPDISFSYFTYYDYDDRYIEYSEISPDQDENTPMGLYDTKEYRVLFAPQFSDVTVIDDDCFLVWKRDGEYGISDFRQYHINRKGEIIYPWLYKQKFAIVYTPDKNNVAAVASSKYSETTQGCNGYIEHNGKKYERSFVYGLYSAKEKFVLPQEYDDIRNVCDNIWCCYKDGVITVVQTEPSD